MRPLVLADQLLHRHLSVVALRRLAALDPRPVLAVFSERLAFLRDGDWKFMCQFSPKAA